MAFTCLESLEDPKRRFLAPTIWSLRLAGLVLPNNIFGVCTKLFVHINVLYLVITQFIEIYFVRDDIGLVLTNLKIAMLTSTAIVKICSFIFFQNEWNQVFDFINDEDQFERNSQDEEKQNIIDYYTNYSHKLTYFYWFLMLTTNLAHVVAAVCLPLFLFATSEVYRDSFHDGTVHFPHIFSSWTPFDKEKSPGCWFLVIWHYLLSVNGGLILGAYDAGIVALMVFFGGKLDLLRVRCKDMFGRNGKGLSSEEFESNLSHLHQMHVKFMKLSKLFNSLLSPVMFYYVTCCTLMLCSSLFQLTSETDLFKKLLLAQYFIFGVAQLFLVCLHSNNCYIKSQEVVMGPYESEWWNSSATTRQKRDMLILCRQLDQANKFTAGPFTELNLQTFVKILKGAYSYYAVMQDQT